MESGPVSRETLRFELLYVTVVTVCWEVLVSAMRLSCVKYAFLRHGIATSSEDTKFRTIDEQYFTADYYIPIHSHPVLKWLPILILVAL